MSQSPSRQRPWGSTKQAGSLPSSFQSDRWAELGQVPELVCQVEKFLLPQEQREGGSAREAGVCSQAGAEPPSSAKARPGQGHGGRSRGPATLTCLLRLFTVRLHRALHLSSLCVASQSSWGSPVLAALARPLFYTDLSSGSEITKKIKKNCL